MCIADIHIHLVPPDTKQVIFYFCPKQHSKWNSYRHTDMSLTDLLPFAKAIRYWNTIHNMQQITYDNYDQQKR